jgi:Co/Zn/Cd efflux system component
MRKKKQDFQEFILMALLGTGPLEYEELWEKFIRLVSHFAMGSMYFEEWGESFRGRVNEFMSRFGIGSKKKRLIRRKIRKREPLEPKFKENLSELLDNYLIQLNNDEKYELTDKGIRQAKEYKRNLEKGASVFRKEILSPGGTARNTIIVDFLLAVMKLAAGFLSGSVALIADGADAAIDTASAVIVWLGLKFKKEYMGTLIIILMMFLTGLCVGLESISTLYEAVVSTIEPISRPYLVISMEVVALIAAALLSIYQRYVGRMGGSLALISQSIDSKNHIYVAGAVIIGAVFSIFGIHFVDALIGTYLATHILKNAVELSKEALSSMRGEQIDFSKYGMLLEGHYEGYRLKSFQGWIMYSIREEDLMTRKELITSLEEVFKPGYVPIMSEFGFSLGEGVDFEKEFDNLTTPLILKGHLIKEGDNFKLTRDGEKTIDRWMQEMRFYSNK